MTVGERIQEARKRAGHTQKQLAELCEVATGTIQQYELNKRVPRTEQLMKIAKILNVELYDLIGYTPEEQSKHGQKIQRQVLNDQMKRRERKTIHIDKRITKSQDTALNQMELLNGNGQVMAVKQIKLLTQIPKYTKDEEQALSNYMEFIKDKGPNYWEKLKDALQDIEKSDKG